MGKVTLHSMEESLIDHPNIIDIHITAGIASKPMLEERYKKYDIMSKAKH